MNINNCANRSSILLTSIITGLVIVASSATAHGQIVLTITRNVKVHAQPTLTSETIDGLTSASTVTLIEGSRSGNFFRVRLQNDRTGWVHGRYLLLPSLEERPFGTEAALMAPSAAAAAFPLCGPERHYRWKEKITTSGFNQIPTKPSVNTALNWSPLSFSGHDLLSWCNDRTPREKKVFTIRGWVRRTRKEDDGDVHVEITQNAADAVEDCFVVEIPPANLSSSFSKARDDLLSLLGMTEVQDKDFNSPIRIKFTGLAFWDGWHATSGLPVKHGRCNSTKGAAWELHPVFEVAPP